MRPSRDGLENTRTRRSYVEPHNRRHHRAAPVLSILSAQPPGRAVPVPLPYLPIAPQAPATPHCSADGCRCADNVCSPARRAPLHAQNNLHRHSACSLDVRCTCESVSRDQVCELAWSISTVSLVCTISFAHRRNTIRVSAWFSNPSTNVLG